MLLPGLIGLMIDVLIIVKGFIGNDGDMLDFTIDCIESNGPFSKGSVANLDDICFSIDFSPICEFEFRWLLSLYCFLMTVVGRAFTA